MKTSESLVVVTPVLNDWPCVQRLISDIGALEALSGTEVTLVVVDDGSMQIEAPDREHLVGHVRRLIIVELNANQGHQRAIALGLAYVSQNLTADRVVVMDSDGEDQPAALGALLEASKIHPGKIIVAERSKRSESLAFRTFYQLYKLIFWSLTGKPISFGNFSMIPLERLPNLLFNQGIWNNYAATLLRSRIGLHFVPTERGARYAGESKMSFTSLMLHGLSAIAVFTDIVIGRIIALLTLASVLTALAIAYVVIIKFTTDTFVPGYATNIILFLITILALCLFTGFLFILSLLSARSNAFALPSTMLPALVRSVTTVTTAPDRVARIAP